MLQLIMNIPFTAIHFATYESCKKLLALQEDESLAVQLAAGGTAGGVSAALTTPLDVVKTRLQLEGVNSATRYQSTAVVRCHTIMHLIMHFILSRHGQKRCCILYGEKLIDTARKCCLFAATLLLLLL